MGKDSPSDLTPDASPQICARCEASVTRGRMVWTDSGEICASCHNDAIEPPATAPSRLRIPAIWMVGLLCAAVGVALVWMAPTVLTLLGVLLVGVVMAVYGARELRNARFSQTAHDLTTEEVAPSNDAEQPSVRSRPIERSVQKNG